MINFLFQHTPLFYLVQSIWRDEAFSYFMAKANIFQIILNTASDFNPPLYYLLLHFWIKLVGKSDIGLRLLSLLPHLLTTFFGFLLGEKIASKKKSSSSITFGLMTATFVFLNPMLLYYAFEIRMYSWYAFFAFATFYFLFTKKWQWYAFFSVLGLYTHSFFLLLTFSFILSSILFAFWQKSTKKNIIKTALPLLFYLPWVPILIKQFLNSGNSWIFPVDLQLVKSVLGNLFTGYEGTPGNWWSYTFILSLFILFTMLPIFFKPRKEILNILIPLFLPLFLVLGYSFLRRPIFVNRYLIFITVLEIIAIVFGIAFLKRKIFKNSLFLFWIFFCLGFNFAITPHHKKTDFKTTFMEINQLAKKGDFVYAETPIAFLESAYYFQDEKKVFVYNPQNITIPNYIGINVVFPNVSRTTFPKYPAKTFLVRDDASYEVVIEY